MDGIVNINKEKGYTSHDVVAKMRGILNQRKIGHTGTLDPDATGVLPVCLGKATKICEYVTDMEKTYRTICRLGIDTDTQDGTGRVIRRREVRLTEEEVRKAVRSFLGVQEQVPPMYSALKINGKRLYELARQGKVVERKPRRVIFHELNVWEMDLVQGHVKVEVVCSKGTYIRTLCQDIGERLGTGAYMEELVRTKVGRFSIEDALTLGQVEEAVRNGRLINHVTPIDAMFDSFVSAIIRKEYQKKVYSGGGFFMEEAEIEPKTEQMDIGQRVRVYGEDGQFIGLYEYRGKMGFKLIKIFI